jgi:hypothetical protein
VSAIIVAGGDRVIKTLLLIFLALIDFIAIWVDNSSLLGLAEVNLFNFLFFDTIFTVAVITGILVN